MPQGVDLVAAGALAVAFGTSHVALVHRAQLTSGQVYMLCFEFDSLVAVCVECLLFCLFVVK